jgi:L-asparaginase
LTFAQKPKIRIIATGGTIAGVSPRPPAGLWCRTVGIQTLIDAVPQVKVSPTCRRATS